MQLFLTKYKLPFDTERVTEYIFGLKNMLKEYEELVDKKDEVVHDDAIEKLQESSNKIEAFITKYYGASQGDNYLELIHDLQYGSETYRYLFAKKQALAQFENERNEVLKVIQDFFDRLNIKMQSDLYTQLVNMKSHLQAYRICLQEWEHADAEVKKFEAAEDMNVIKNTQLPEKLESLETLHAQLVEIAEQIDETHKFLDEITKVVSDLYLKKEEFDDAEDSLKDLSENMKQTTRNTTLSARQEISLKLQELISSVNISDLLRQDFQSTIIFLHMNLQIVIILMPIHILRLKKKECREKYISSVADIRI